VPRHRRFLKAHYNKAFVHERLGQVLAAGEAYHRAVSLRPTYLEARLNLAALHHRYGRIR
jgi:Tfp pilus assembly protein PilF